MPRVVHWGSGRKCDFYTTNTSCTNTIRNEFRAHRESDLLDKVIDDAITVNKAISERVHLLFADPQHKKLLTFTTPDHVVDTDSFYELKRATLTPEKVEALDRALQFIDGANEMLNNPDVPVEDKTRIAKAYYRESINSFPTAEAYAYLGWYHYLDGELALAEDKCKLAIELDPSFGNPYNDLALIRLQQGRDDEAIALFTNAKRAPRYHVRHFPCLNLAALHLENDRILPALHEYIEALRYMDEEAAQPIRATVADMATFIVTVASSSLN